MSQIFLVEDTAADAELFGIAHKRIGSTTAVTIFRDGEAALSHLMGEASQTLPELANHSLILLDLYLPRLSGLEVLERLRADGRWRDVPIVIFTSASLDADRKRALALGANGFARKPAGFERLCETIRDLEREWLGVESS